MKIPFISYSPLPYHFLSIMLMMQISSYIPTNNQDIKSLLPTIKTVFEDYNLILNKGELKNRENSDRGSLPLIKKSLVLF